MGVSPSLGEVLQKHSSPGASRHDHVPAMPLPPAPAPPPVPVLVPPPCPPVAVAPPDETPPVAARPPEPPARPPLPPGPEAPPVPLEPPVCGCPPPPPVLATPPVPPDDDAPAPHPAPTHNADPMTTINSSLRMRGTRYSRWNRSPWGLSEQQRSPFPDGFESCEAERCRPGNCTDGAYCPVRSMRIVALFHCVPRCSRWNSSPNAGWVGARCRRPGVGGLGSSCGRCWRGRCWRALGSRAGGAAPAVSQRTPPRTGTLSRTSKSGRTPLPSIRLTPAITPLLLAISSAL